MVTCMRIGILGSLKLLIILTTCGLVLTFISSVYKSEVDFHPSYMLPCVMQIFAIPLRQTNFGWPTPWLVHIEGVRRVGCGPIVGSFSTYSPLRQGLLFDVLFYAAICFLVLIPRDFGMKLASLRSERD